MFGKYKRVSGFTLIELLVVIGIISTLAAILFPAFMTVREKAREASCASNLHQLAIGFQMYTDDQNNALPPCFYALGGPLNEYPAWPAAIEPYVKSKTIDQCPSLSSTDLSTTSDPSWPKPAAWAQFAEYGYNWVYLAPISAIPAADGNYYPLTVTTSEIGAPSETILLTDSGEMKNGEKVGTCSVDPPYGDGFVAPGTANSWWFGGWYLLTQQGSPTTNGLYGRVDPRHGQMTNVAFADGHVKSYLPSQLIEPQEENGQMVTDALWDLQ